jgi:hypothetical protein
MIALLKSEIALSEEKQPVANHIKEVHLMNKSNCCSDEGRKTLQNPKIKSIKIRVKKDTNRASETTSEAFVKEGCSCNTQPAFEVDPNAKVMEGVIKTRVGNIPKVSSRLALSDLFGSIKARWGINRMNYKVHPGLYAVGTPDNNSPVIVTANYKLTFDNVRKELADINIWILVIDTKGINVWCAAGKGTFGTSEIVSRIKKVNLRQLVSHRTIILPQLGAPGVVALDVQRLTGFKVVYGPVRAKYIKKFIRLGFTADAQMRRVEFGIYDRLVLTPIELIGSLKISIIIFGVFFLINLIAASTFGTVEFCGYIGAVFTGCVLTPVLLPYIPGRAFAWKGWIIGLIWAIGVNLMNGWPGALHYGGLKAIAFLLILPAISSFGAMNFTGASTYTSLSGVVKEMKYALPLIIASAFMGTVIFILNIFVKLG